LFILNREIYNVYAHPQVQKGEITPEQAFNEFIKNFGDRKGDGSITRTV